MELELIGKLFEYGLGIAVLAVLLWLTRQDLKHEREKVEERDKYIRESDRENLLVLRTMSSAIDKIGEDGKREFKDVQRVVKEAEERIVSHIKDNHK